MAPQPTLPGPTRMQLVPWYSLGAGAGLMLALCLQTRVQPEAAALDMAQDVGQAPVAQDTPRH